MPAELNLCSPWHRHSGGHGLISALKGCCASLIVLFCLPVIGLINRLTDDPRLSHPVTLEEGDTKSQQRKRAKRQSGQTCEPFRAPFNITCSHFQFCMPERAATQKRQIHKKHMYSTQVCFFFYINLLMKISRFSRYFTGLFPCCLVNIFYTEILFAFFLSQFRRPTKASHNELYSDSDSFE